MVACVCRHLPTCFLLYRLAHPSHRPCRQAAWPPKVGGTAIGAFTENQHKKS